MYAYLCIWMYVYVYVYYVLVGISFLYIWLRTLRPGVVLLSREFLKDVDEEFRVSFVRHEVKKMYLAKGEGHCYMVAFCTVEECDTQQSELPDNASEFPLGESHQELEVCQLDSH